MATGSTTPDITITAVGNWIKVEVPALGATVYLQREDIDAPYVSGDGKAMVTLRKWAQGLDQRLVYDPVTQSISINSTVHAAGTWTATAALDALVALLPPAV